MIDQAGRTRKSKKKTKRERENNKGWAEGCREELVLNLHVDEYTHARQRGFIAERRAFGNLVNHFFTFFPYWLEDTDEYFVERIIGRRPISRQDNSSTKKPNGFMWLVKWDGYVNYSATDVSEYADGARLYRYKANLSTWAADKDLGDCSRLIEEFELAAEIEGRRVEALYEPILLNEAKAAGW